MRTLTGVFLSLAMALSINVARASAADAPINLRHTITVEVVEKTKDAVVYISSKKIVAQRVNPFGNDPIWQQFDFGTRYVPVGSLGSGFIVHRDGYIITNNHVIDRARQIQVELLDGRKYQAELISADVEADLAVLKIAPDKPLPTLELGDSSDLMIGEPVIAVGNPLGFSHTVSTGIVSAMHRDLKSGDEILLGDLIQTDAAINPGNSGGPLLNAYGQVIGINTAIRGDAQNIGFAIQVNKLRDLIPALLNPAEVRKLDLPLKLREKRSIEPPATLSSQVLLADGDVAVISIAGRKPQNLFDAYAILLDQKPGQAFDVELQGRKPIRIALTPAPLPEVMVKARTKLGVVIEPVTPMLSEKYKLATEDGMFVTEVVRDSIAARAGVQPGDVILQLGRFRISNLSDFAYLMNQLPETGKVTIGFARANTAYFRVLQF